MNVFKRVCSIVLVVVLVLSVFTVAIYSGVFAEEPATAPSFTVSAAQKNITDGNSTTVKINLAGDNAYGVQFALSYNKDVFKPTGVTTDLSETDYYLESNLDYAEGKIFIMIFCLTGKKIPVGTIATVAYNTLASTVGVEDTSLVFSEMKISDKDGAPYDASCVTTVNGEIRGFDASASTLKFASRNLILGSDITLCYYVSPALESEYSDVYVEFKLGDRTVIARRETALYQGYLQFKFVNVNPYEYAQDIKATLYGTYNSKKYQSNCQNYSIVEYCAASFAGSDANLKTMAADMLNYGASVQKYLKSSAGKDTGILCNEDPRVAAYVDLYETKGEVAPQNDKNTNVKQPASRTTYWDNANLALGSKVSMQFYFDLENAELGDITIKVYDAVDKSLKHTYTSKDYAHYGDIGGHDCYYIKFSDFGVAYMRRPVWIVAYNKSGDEVSRTYQYSIESYAYSIVENSGSYEADFVQVCKDMVKYGRSAEKYAGVVVD